VPIRVDGTVGAANSCGWTGPAPFKERRRMAMWRKEKLTHWPIDANQISEPRVTFRPAPMLLAHPTPLRRHTLRGPLRDCTWRAGPGRSSLKTSTLAIRRSGRGMKREQMYSTRTSASTLKTKPLDDRHGWIRLTACHSNRVQQRQRVHRGGLEQI
jgi:hypothetical protein